MPWQDADPPREKGILFFAQRCPQLARPRPVLAERGFHFLIATAWHPGCQTQRTSESKAKPGGQLGEASQLCGHALVPWSPQSKSLLPLLPL